MDTCTETANVLDVNSIADQVMEIMISAMNSTIGKKLSSGRRTAPWWTTEYNDLRIQSQRCYERAQRTKTAQDWATFAATRKAKNVLKRKLQSRQANADEHNTAHIWSKDFGSKAAWSAAKRLRDSRAGSSKTNAIACRGINNEEGELVHKPAEIAEVFRKHYATLASPSTCADLSETHRAQVEADVMHWRMHGKDAFQQELDADFTVDEIEAAMDKLPMHKAADGEDIIGELIRHGGGQLRTLLLRLVNWVWKAETVPVKWGAGVVVNLFKTGDSLVPGNYRGITLIPIIRKIFSTMIRLRLEKKIALHESQAAFRVGRSCVDHIFTLSQIVHDSGNVNKSLYTFFLDIKKAYDTV